MWWIHLEAHTFKTENSTINECLLLCLLLLLLLCVYRCVTVMGTATVIAAGRHPFVRNRDLAAVWIVDLFSMTVSWHAHIYPHANLSRRCAKLSHYHINCVNLHALLYDFRFSIPAKHQAKILVNELCDRQTLANAYFCICILWLLFLRFLFNILKCILKHFHSLFHPV